LVWSRGLSLEECLSVFFRITDRMPKTPCERRNRATVFYRKLPQILRILLKYCPQPIPGSAVDQWLLLTLRVTSPKKCNFQFGRLYSSRRAEMLVEQMQSRINSTKEVSVNSTKSGEIRTVGLSA
jgi:hypothetical protein